MDFPGIVRSVAEQRGFRLPPAQHPEPLGGLDYDDELALKREALTLFWREQRLPGRPEPIVAASLPRGYRSTTKRRAVASAGAVALVFPGSRDRSSGVSSSVLDPEEHVRVYTFLAERLARPPARALANALSWAIVRGAAGSLAVILNVRILDARVVRAAKLLAAALQEAPLGVRAAFLYLDPSGSEYYLEARRPAGMLSSKRLFGPDWLEVRVEGVRLRFSPFVFSQVNPAMLGAMTAAARSLLAPSGDCSLLDLYCGYGLFSLTVGQDAANVVGVDVDGPAVEAARSNAEHLGQAGRVRFLAGRIDAEFLASRVRPARVPEVALLDPPRLGTSPGVVAVLAGRRPRRVVHICCGTDEIPREVEAWSRDGYRLKTSVPLDLFAGTANLETMLLLAP